LIGGILGVEVVKEHGPPRPGDIRDSWADVTAARDVLGWEPTVDIEEGLSRTILSVVE
jgi:UDP-glucose 4-epimerase